MISNETWNTLLFLNIYQDKKNESQLNPPKISSKQHNLLKSGRKLVPKWKSLITSAIYKYWSDRINGEINYYSTLKYLSPTYKIRKIHPIIRTNTVNQKDINRIPIGLKLATGNYMLQSMRAAYNQNPINLQTV